MRRAIPWVVFYHDTVLPPLLLTPVLHILISHVTHRNKYVTPSNESMLSPLLLSPQLHICISHVAHLNESYLTYEWVLLHIWMSHVRVMSESHTRISWFSLVLCRLQYYSLLHLECHLISISLVSFQRNMVKETWRTRSLIEIWESSHDTSNAIGCTSKENNCNVSWATSLKENHTSCGTPKRAANLHALFRIYV